MNKAIRNYTCINCGSPIKDLYKKYSETVLKLTECDRCKSLADKYLEYDTVIIIIDLILLRIMAFRHFLLNSKMKNFWKLSIILLILESYMNYTVSFKEISKQAELNYTEPYLTDPDIYLEDLKFYMLCVDVIICTFCFIAIIYVFTIIYTTFKRRERVSLLMIYKMVTLSSSGTFLFLPSLMWDISVYSFHLHFISIYTTLSQLLAYKAMCNCEKTWTLLIILSSILLKIYIKNSLNSVTFVNIYTPD